jgi:hypothetical protein
MCGVDLQGFDGLITNAGASCLPLTLGLQLGVASAAELQTLRCYVVVMGEGLFTITLRGALGMNK